MTSVLVIGATGQQGGAVANHLLSGEYGEFDVHALSRSPESDAWTSNSPYSPESRWFATAPPCCPVAPTTSTLVMVTGPLETDRVGARY